MGAILLQHVGRQLDVKPKSHRADAEVKICKYRFPILFLTGFFKAIIITLCFILTNDLEINKLNFVVGHGIAVQLDCTTI